MNSINHVLLLGNLTRDPELRYTPSGTAVCQLGMALNRRWKDQAGEIQQETTFVDVTVWARQAETVSAYLAKGRAVAVEGRLQLDTWDWLG
jgi:single-strand DNA-binding protein